MRILIFMTQFGKPSGAERLAIELAEDLNKRGIHCDILSMYTADFLDMAKVRKDLLLKGIPRIRFLGMKLHPPIWSMVPAILKLRRLILKGGYDIVETSMSTPSIIAAWSCRVCDTQHVNGIHDVFVKDRYNTIKYRFWRYSLRNNRKTRFYAISEYAAKHWKPYSATSPDRTRTIYNAISNDFFETIADREGLRAELGILSEGRIALFVGRLLKRKGIDTIYDALSHVLREENIFLLYVGGEDSPEACFPDDMGLLERLKACIKHEGLDDRVFFLGRRKDVPRLMASSDVLVHPARIEGFGLVLAEAMAVGLPVIASSVDGIPEVLAGTDSIMVSPDDSNALRAAVLETLHRTPSEAARAIENGRKRAEAFRIEKRTNAMIGLFENVLDGKF